MPEYITDDIETSSDSNREDSNEENSDEENFDEENQIQNINATKANNAEI